MVTGSQASCYDRRGLITIAAFSALVVLAQGKGKSTDPTVMSPNMPVQAGMAVSGPQPADVSVKPILEQSADERRPEKQKKKARTNSHGHISSTMKIDSAEAKNEAADEQLQSFVDRVIVKGSPSEERKEVVPDHVEDNGWRIRK